MAKNYNITYGSKKKKKMSCEDADDFNLWFSL